MGRWNNLLAGCLIIFAAALAYRNSFSGPLVGDDVESIAENPTIRNLKSPGSALSPPSGEGQTVGGRPLLNLSFALNYAVGGTAVRGYHATNLLIHILAGLVLFGIVRRTLDRRTEPGALPPSSVALAVALAWTLHPLQTGAVTYVVQRAESLMGLFYLLTLYGFIRYAAEAPASATPGTKPKPGSAGWAVLSVLACLLGMATKEVMVSAPVIVLLYDAAFVSGTIRRAWHRHPWLYGGLAASWLVLIGLVLVTGTRGHSMGFGAGVGWGDFILTQFPAVLLYLRLAVWPHPLIFHYGAEWIRNPWSVLPAATLVAALLAGTFWLWWRRPRWGFLGVWFWAILAPTSLVPGIHETMTEHRMYLALIPLLVAGAFGAEAASRWLARKLAPAPAAAAWHRRLFLAGTVGLAAGYAAITFCRNETYRSDLALWNDTVAKRPNNAHARNALGQALATRGPIAEAAGEFAEAIRLDPAQPDARVNLANILLRQGGVEEAMAQYRQALRLDPNCALAHYDLGVALAQAEATGGGPDGVCGDGPPAAGIGRSAPQSGERARARWPPGGRRPAI